MIQAKGRTLAAQALVIVVSLLGGSAASAQQRLELFDAHLHYNQEPNPFYSLDQVLDVFRRNGVTGILATSRPNKGTHQLVAAKAPGLWVVPFIRPYRTRGDIQTWFADPTIYELIEQEFRRGYYRGVGEFHIYGQSAAAPLVKKIVDFAVEHDLYLHAHCDEAALLQLFAHNPRAKIIWAHTGFTTPPARVQELLERYPALWGELSYRSGIGNGQGRLSEDWRRLFASHSDRFLLGSDTWINERWFSYDAIQTTAPGSHNCRRIRPAASQTATPSVCSDRAGPSDQAVHVARAGDARNVEASRLDRDRPGNWARKTPSAGSLCSTPIGSARTSPIYATTRSRLPTGKQGDHDEFLSRPGPRPRRPLSCEAIKQVIVPRTADLGDGFTVRRALPSAQSRMVGPFVFFDHFGPAVFRSGNGLDVRPHPHIGLATVTYLFDGEIMHRDSLGTAVADPARRGQLDDRRPRHRAFRAHRRRAPRQGRQACTACRCWVALPAAQEEMAPAFAHHGVEDFPMVRDNGQTRARGGRARLYGARSPVVDHVRHAVRRRDAQGRLVAAARRRSRGARDLYRSTARSTLPATGSAPNACWCSVPATASPSAR